MASWDSILYWSLVGVAVVVVSVLAVGFFGLLVALLLMAVIGEQRAEATVGSLRAFRYTRSRRDWLKALVAGILAAGAALVACWLLWGLLLLLAQFMPWAAAALLATLAGSRAFLWVMNATDRGTFK